MFEIIKKENYKVSNWSGGSTSEIFLEPKNGSYSERVFDFRISSATVELEESDFTPLAGVKRYLTTLEGDLDLTFQEEESRKVLLKPYEVVCFMGDVPTHSVGKAKDFNLMLKGCEGKMHTFSGKEVALELKCNTEVFVYSLRDWTGEIEHTEVIVNGEDTLHLFGISDETQLRIKSEKDNQWVIIEVQYETNGI